MYIRIRAVLVVTATNRNYWSISVTIVEHQSEKKRNALYLYRL